MATDIEQYRQRAGYYSMTPEQQAEFDTRFNYVFGSSLPGFDRTEEMRKIQLERAEAGFNDMTEDQQREFLRSQMAVNPLYGHTGRMDFMRDYVYSNLFGGDRFGRNNEPAPEPNDRVYTDYVNGRPPDPANVYLYGNTNPLNQNLYMDQQQVDNIYGFMDQVGKGSAPTSFTAGETTTGQSGMQYTPVTGKGGNSGFSSMNTAPIQQTSDGTNFQAVQGKGGPPETQGKGGSGKGG